MLDDLLDSSGIRNLGACLENTECNWDCRIIEIEMLNVGYGYFLSKEMVQGVVFSLES
jgi:hypothetical protein